MSYKQVRGFNANALARVGMCLEYIQNAYGSNWAGYSAWDGWSNRLSHRHADRNFPANVIIPIWFSGTWAGSYFGHVAALNTATGQVYTSPYFKATGYEVYNSIDSLIATFRGAMPDIKYVGWSEDIGGIRIIQKESIVPRIGKENNWRWRFNRLHWQLVGNWDMSDATFKAIIGNDAWWQVEQWSDHSNANQAIEDQKLGELARKDKWQKQIYDLQAQVKTLGSRPTKEQLDAVKKQVADLQFSAGAAQGQAEQAKKDFEETSKKLKEMAEEQEKSKRAADGFFTNVILNIIERFTK